MNFTIGNISYDTEEMIVLCERIEALPTPKMFGNGRYLTSTFFTTEMPVQTFKILHSIFHDKYFKIVNEPKETYCTEISYAQAIYLSHKDYPNNEFKDALIQQVHRDRRMGR